MIEYSKDTDELADRNLMYFTEDGSWGSADDVVIIDVTELDGHFSDFIDELKDWQLPDFMRWYVNNQTHDQMQGEYTACQVCEYWDNGMTEDEILEDLENDNA
jgi:hypothetical protein